MIPRLAPSVACKADPDEKLFEGISPDLMIPLIQKLIQNSKQINQSLLVGAFRKTYGYFLLTTNAIQLVTLHTFKSVVDGFLGH